MSRLNETTNKVNFAKGTQAGYEALSSYDTNTLYYCKDSGNTYLGTDLLNKNAFVSVEFTAATKTLTFTTLGINGDVNNAYKKSVQLDYATVDDIKAAALGIEAGSAITFGSKTNSEGDEMTVINVAFDNSSIVLDNSGKLSVSDTYIDGKISSTVSSVYKYKGSCTYAELPSTDLVVGDVWNVTDEYKNGDDVYPAGTNYAWNGTSWDPLGGSLKGLATESYADQAATDALNSAKEYADGLVLYWNNIVD